MLYIKIYADYEVYRRYDYTFSVSYELLPRIFGPYLEKTHGIGSNAKLTKPSRLVAQAMPKPSYIWNVKSGNAAPQP